MRTPFKVLWVFIIALAGWAAYSSFTQPFGDAAASGTPASTMDKNGSGKEVAQAPAAPKMTDAEIQNCEMTQNIAIRTAEIAARFEGKELAVKHAIKSIRKNSSPACLTKLGITADTDPEDAELTISSVELGNAVDNDGNVSNGYVSRTGGHVATSDLNIYISVHTSGGISGKYLTANWSVYTSDTVSKQIAQSALPVVSTGPSVTTFKLQSASPWPVGYYKIELWWGGRFIGDKYFQINNS